MKNIYILILNYNGSKDAVKCLKTLYKLQDKSYRLTTVLIDNGSTQQQLNRLKDFISSSRNIKNYQLRNLKILENKKNLGFAKGNNVGIKYALRCGADYLLLLNNDTKVEMNFLKNLLKIDAPISSPVVKFREFKESPRLIFDLGGFVNWWTGRTAHLNAYRKTYNIYKERGPIEVDYVAGCSIFVKREVFEKIGLLDEKYFIYFEDVDFCVTARKHGFGVVVDPKSVIYHKLGGSMDRWSKRAIFHNLFGNFIFISKHLGLRRITGYTYLLVLTAKIIFDRIRQNISL